MRDGFGRSAVIGLIVAGAIAAGMTVYKGMPRRARHSPAPAQPASPPGIPGAEAKSSPDKVIGLGDLNVIGKGGPRPYCEAMPETPSLSLSFSQAGDWPGAQEICNALRSVARKIEACHLNALRRQPAPPDKLTLTLVVDQGRVKRAKVDELTEPHERSTLAACLVQVARKLRFDPPREFGAELTIWLDFGASE